MLTGQQNLSVALKKFPGRHCHEFASQVVVLSFHAALAGKEICSLGALACIIITTHLVTPLPHLLQLRASQTR